MSTPDLSAKLPPPHDEEPAQLRSDILDELQDHLTCATDRERRRLELSEQPADSATIWQSVIERFGDPSALARRLWFDAMKGRLMAQRAMLTAVFIGLLVVVAWMTILSRSLTAVIGENQKATAEILDRLRKEPPSQITSEAMGLSPVRFTLVQETVSGKPAQGMIVHFDEHSSDRPVRLGDMSETTNGLGVADFGVLPYGIYDLSIDSPAGNHSEQITLRPGRPIDMPIVVPGPQDSVRVEFPYQRPDWENWKWTTPDHKPPAGEPVLLVRYLSQSEVQVNNRNWRSADEIRYVMVRPDGIYPKLTEIVETKTYSLAQFGGGGAVKPLNDGTENEDRLIDLSSRVDTLSCPKGRLTLTAEWFYTAVDAADVPRGQVLVHPVAPLLDRDFASSLEKVPGSDAVHFPLIVLIDPAEPQPNVIRIPPNHPSTLDGEELPPIFSPKAGGGGGGGGFFAL